MHSSHRAKGKLQNPIHEHRIFHRKDSKIAVAGHAIHAMLVTFPIALCACTLGTDLLYW